MKTHSRYDVARWILICWCLFIGIGAVGGAATMIADPSGRAIGMEKLLPDFQVLPFADVLFQNYTFPGFALLAVNGIPNLIAAGLLFARKRSGVICGGIFGVTLMLWICIQFVIFEFNIMSTSYFVFGLLQAVTGYAAWVFDKQESFAVNAADYPNIGKNHKRLVVYFSRMGYTRKVALEQADRTGADVYEVKSTEQTRGTLGFWWCGRFGMHRWDMPIEDITIDLTAYEHVTICSPIWVFHLAAPMRGFCRGAKGKIKEADYVLLHFRNTKYEYVARELDELLGITGTGAVSKCCKYGDIKHKGSSENISKVIAKPDQ